MAVVEGVPGLTVVDKVLCDIRDGGSDRSDQEVLTVG